MNTPYRCLILLWMSCFAISAAYAQKDTRKISIRITNSDLKPQIGARVELIDNNGKSLFSSTDKFGVAWFDIYGASALYTRARTIVTTKESNRFEQPITLGIRQTRFNVEVPDDMVIMVDGTKTSDKGLFDPTENVHVSKVPPMPHIEEVTWGPYTPDCDNNPLASVPEFSSFAVEDESLLLDQIGTECFGAAEDVVTAMVDLTKGITSLGLKAGALYTQLSQRPVSNAVLTKGEAAGNEIQKTQAAVGVAYENSKALYEAMTSIAEGPEMYAITCMWSGIKKYATPEDVTKMQKALGSFQKAKSAMQKKVQALATLKASKQQGVTAAAMAQLKDWDDINTNVSKSWDGLNMMIAFVNNPEKLLPNEQQANLALSNLEPNIGTLLGDCRIRAMDEQAKDGIEAAKSALAASRKSSAQMAEKERKWRDAMTEAAGTRPWYNPGFEGREIPQNAMAPVIGTEGAWAQYVAYHNEKVNADKSVQRIGITLGKLTEMCSRIQSYAPTLNKLVEDYNALYAKGTEAVVKCDFQTTEDVVAKLKYQEGTACGHYYPSNFGVTRGQELENRMNAMKRFGNCSTPAVAKKPNTGRYGLVKKEIGLCPAPSENNYGVVSCSEAEGSSIFDYKGKEPYEADAHIVVNFSRPPSTLKPGDEIEVSVDVNAKVTGKDVPYIGVSGKWSTEGAAEIVSGQSAFGGYASDGKLYPQGSQTYKIKIGEGSKIVFWTTTNGFAFGTGGKWYACIYTYEWQKDPIPDDAVGQ